MSSGAIIWATQPLLNCDLAFEGDTAGRRGELVLDVFELRGQARDLSRGSFRASESRGKGYGKALLAHLAKTAVEAGAIRVDWSVLDWNKPSIDFYDSLGAQAPSTAGSYTACEDEALAKLGGG